MPVPGKQMQNFRGPAGERWNRESQELPESLHHVFSGDILYTVSTPKSSTLFERKMVIHQGSHEFTEVDLSIGVPLSVCSAL